MIDRAHRVALGLMLAVYVALSVTYAVVTPVFEAPDESSHLQVIRYIRRTGRLVPYQIPPRRADTGPNMAWLVSYHDPPLYYAPPLYHALGALLTCWTTMEDLPGRLVPSPSWEVGFAPQRGSEAWNKNVFVHLPGESLTESAMVRATALLRVVSMLLGAAALVGIYLIADLLWPGRPLLRLGAVAVVMLTPQFLAGSAAVSNDPLIIALSTLSLYAMLRLAYDDASWQRWALVGALVGLGLLTKQSGLMLLPLGGLAALHGCTNHTQRPRGSRGFWCLFRRAAAFGLAALVVGGSWYWVNLLRHQDPLGTVPHYQIQVPLTRYDWKALGATFQSFWAAFGWTLITAPKWVYAVVGSFGALALVGIVRSLLPGGAFWQQTRNSRFGMLFLGLAFVMNFLALTRWASATGAPYGRLLFPTLAAIGVWGAWGVSQLPLPRRRVLVCVACGLGLTFAALAPWLLIRPAFATPYLQKGVPSSATTVVETDFGAVRLVGYELGEQDLEPGAQLPVTLYWQADESPLTLLAAWVQLSGLDPTARVAGDSRWLGGTLYPCQLWQPGDVVAHSVTLEVPAWTPAPALYWLRVGLLDEERDRLAMTTDGDDHATIGPWAIREEQDIPASAVPLEYRLGPAIELSAYEIRRDDNALLVTLYWHATEGPSADYTVFVHLLDGTDTLIAQGDGPPRGGAYPTSWWRPGEIVPDTHEIPSAPASDSGMKLLVGTYVLDSGERLPAYNANGERLQDDAIVLPLAY